jgi:hypothetical protein
MVTRRHGGRRLRRVFVLTLVACAGVTGLGIPDATAQTTTTCDLLTRSEIKRVFKGRTAKGLLNGPMCTYEIQGGSAKRGGADLELVAAGKATVEYDAGGTAEAVSGLGDEAYFDASDDRLGVKQGDTTLLVRYLFNPLRTKSPPSDQRIQGRLERVAEYALERCRSVAPSFPCGSTDLPD